MKRRTFVQTSLATVAAATAGALAADPKPKTGEYYELRTYSLHPDKRAKLDRYLSKAFMPALKRFGIGPVGVFVDEPKDNLVKVYALIVHRTAESCATLSARLAADDEHQKAAADYLEARPNDPVYQRIESALLAAFEGMPQLAKPDTTKPRLFNLRIYESHNERAGKKKIEMFNKGEITIFKRVGLTPVIFGETIVGAAMPNLTYLLVFPNEDGRKAAWDRFRVDAEWLKLRAIPEYADKEIVSRITNLVLTPAAYSEI